MKNSPLFALGFRPFYTLAAMFAIIAVALWLLSFTGMAQFGSQLQGVLWHSHEMAFGFIPAVIAGFLFTAVRNWTGQPTPTGWLLGVIAFVWLAARLLLVWEPGNVGVVLDVLFLPIVAISVAVPIFRSANKRNYKVVFIAAVIAVLHFAYHLAHGGELPGWLLRGSLFATIDVVVILFALIGGRVIPAFTRNAVQGSDPAHKTWVEVIAFGSLILLAGVTLLSGGVGMPAGLAVSLAFIAAAANAVRLAYWQPGVTRHNPLLWMMPVAYSWLPVALVLRALSGMGTVFPGSWIHALTAGALTSLMVAMIMRSTLGHTGRKLEASRADVIIFLLLQLAVVLRILAGVVGDHRTMTIVAGLVWMAAFAGLFIRYAPMLLRARADGKPG